MEAASHEREPEITEMKCWFRNRGMIRDTGTADLTAVGSVYSILGLANWGGDAYGKINAGPLTETRRLVIVTSQHNSSTKGASNKNNDMHLSLRL